MPPFVPRKRCSSSDAPSAKRLAVSLPARTQSPPKPSVEIVDFSSDSGSSASSTSSLSDAPDSEEFADRKIDDNDHVKPTSKDANTTSDSDGDEDDDGDGVDWEDALDTTTHARITATSASNAEEQDLELTLDQNDVHLADLLEGRRGPTKIERQIRIQTHCMHVQCLLFHNALRNAWLNDSELHEILRQKMPAGIKKEVQKCRIASGLETTETKPETSTSSQGKKKAPRGQNRDWPEDATQLEPGQRDMSRGDPIITLLKILATYWKRQFKITAPGLRKIGYRPMAALEAQIATFQKEYSPERHGETIRGVEEFRAHAKGMQGSRDVGAQLFTALLRALGFEARLVASLQPLGFGWTKAEMYTENAKKSDRDAQHEALSGSEVDDEASDDDSAQSGPQSPPRRFDSDLSFPIYWTEVASPVTHEIIPVDPLVLPNTVATTFELQAAFEPRGAKADRSKQVICYVVAHSPDGTAKDVTTRYLRRRTWPGKTKGYRIPVEKIPIPGQRGQSIQYDWFCATMRGYLRPKAQRTRVDELEDSIDLVPNQPDRKPPKAGDTLQSLRSSTEFVLERFLRRDEALRPGATPTRTFKTGKGAHAKDENVFRRADVLKCQSAESWHKEGRQIKPGELPLKRVPVRAVTLLRKREVDTLERQTGLKPTQALYAREQTEYIVPPPICDGVIPKNEYGNIDCFVPSMVPRGAVHVPWPGTVRVCKKLGIDYAEAVTGFEFGSKMAVPVIQGVVVAAENEGLVKDAWRAENAEKRKKEQLKAEKRILQTWRRFLFGLRIAQRVREEYGGGHNAAADVQRDVQNPFSSRKHPPPSGPADGTPEQSYSALVDDLGDDADAVARANPADYGGGFLLPGDGEGDDGNGNLSIETHDETVRPGSPLLSRAKSTSEQDDGTLGDSELSSVVEHLSSPSCDHAEEDGDSGSEYGQPLRRRRGRRTGGKRK